MLETDIFEPAATGYIKTFEFILTQMTRCYYKMLEKYPEIENDEELIRNRLFKDFLKNNTILSELMLKPYIFTAEGIEIGDDYKEKGWIDIKVQVYKDYIENADAYFVIECKRLGEDGLNGLYIKEGIDRFRHKYPSYYGISGMIGFIVAPIDIDKNIEKINQLIPTYYQYVNTTKFLTKHPFIQREITNFDNSYISQHKDKNNNIIDLYHLMWDFSTHIKA